MVIPTYRGRELLDPCLASIEAAGGPVTEVIVVDNASGDGTPAWLGEHRPDVRVVALADNRGYAAACNAGVAVAAGDVVILLNNDVEVQPGWSQALLDALDDDPDVVIAGGLTLHLDDPDRVNTAGITVAASLSGVDSAMGLPRAGVALAPRDVAAVSGVSLAVRRDWLRKTGGMEERFFMYYEDVELCLRAWIEGYRVRLVPNSVVLHAGGATAGAREAPARHFQTTRNRLLTAAKLLEPREAARAWVLSGIADIAAVLALVRRGRPGPASRVAFAKLRALLAALDALPALMDARRTVVRSRRRSTADLRRLGLIEPLRASAQRFSALRGSGGPLR